MMWLLLIGIAAILFTIVLTKLLRRRSADETPTPGYATPPESLKELRPDAVHATLPALYDADALMAVRDGLRTSFKRRGRSFNEADALFGELTANLHVLEQLHALVGKMSAGDAAAWTEFSTHLQYLVKRFPAYDGSMKLLQSRVRNAPPTLKARGPCAIVTLPGMASVYTGVLTAGALSGIDLRRGMEVIAGLSLGHSNLEVISGSLVHDGPDGLDRTIELEESTGNPYFTPPGGKHGKGFTNPLPDGAKGGLAGGGSFFSGLLPDEVHPSNLDACELVRETCEAMFLDALTEGAPEAFELGGPSVPECRVDNIDRVELSGKCAGDMLTIYGSDFGNEPGRRVVVVSGRGQCMRVAVPPLPPRTGNFQIPLDVLLRFGSYWSDTRISLYLPEGITPGPVGIFDPNSIDLYNGWSSGAGRRAQEVVVSSQCMEKPISGELPVDTQISGRVSLPSTYTPCPASTGRNEIEKVGAPVILSFIAAAGQARGDTIVADPKDELTLRWNVINATSIALRKLSTPGPKFSGRIEVVDPPGTSWSFGDLGHQNFEVYTYGLTAANGNSCGTSSATVTVLASKRPRLTINRVEVTQGIQRQDNSVELVENKPTVVRVFAQHKLEGFAGFTAVAPLRGRLRLPPNAGTDCSSGLGSDWSVRASSRQALHKKSSGRSSRSGIRTGSGPGSPTGQPGWGGGCDLFTVGKKNPTVSLSTIAFADGRQPGRSRFRF